MYMSVIVCVCRGSRACVCALRVCMYICVCVCMCVSECLVSACVCVYACMCICVGVYVSAHNAHIHKRLHSSPEVFRCRVTLCNSHRHRDRRRFTPGSPPKAWTSWLPAPGVTLSHALSYAWGPMSVVASLIRSFLRCVLFVSAFLVMRVHVVR